MKNIIRLPLFLVGIIITVFVVEAILPGSFSWLGIRPRSLFGLVGILTSPFLHGSITHLLANALPLLVMGCFVSALSPSLFLYRTFMLVVLSGSLTWLISSSGIVIGASGLVFAYWSFLITNGFLQKRVKDVFIALITFIVYGALIFGLFRFEQGVSWAGHFSGAVAGALFAYLERSSKRAN